MIATPQARPGTLVVVDDHARFRAAVGERLAAAGWRIVGEAATGAAAIDLVAGLPPDSDDSRRVLAVIAFLRAPA